MLDGMFRCGSHLDGCLPALLQGDDTLRSSPFSPLFDLRTHTENVHVHNSDFGSSLEQTFRCVILFLSLEVLPRKAHPYEGSYLPGTAHSGQVCLMSQSLFTVGRAERDRPWRLPRGLDGRGGRGSTEKADGSRGLKP